MTASARQLMESAGVATEPLNQPVHRLFEEQVRLRPDAAALQFRGNTMTYRQLDDRAERLAERLRALGVGPEVMVAVCLERSFELIVALLGILKAGGAYVPLDPNYPAERLVFIREDTGARVILTQRGVCDSLGAMGSAQVVYLDGGPVSEEREAAGSSTAQAGPGTLAYVMYTSGSTGRPKGVMVEHRAIVRLVKNTNFCSFGPEEVFLQLAPISFDASTLEIWGPLLNGGRLVLMPPGTPSLSEIGSTIRQYGVTTMWLTAGLFHLMVDERIEDLRTVRQLLAGGDVLSPFHVRRVLRELPATTLINGYGPTENTTFTCCHVMRPGDTVADSVPIGKPIAHTAVYLLDSDQRPVAVGEIGELYAGGYGVARGYLNGPDGNADKFIADRFGSSPGGKLYRTGDLARQRPDGVFEFLGRTDRQVKIAGHRIEPGEIENQLCGHPSARQAVVVAVAMENGQKQLVAYVVADRDRMPTMPQWRAFLEGSLPQHMCPSLFVRLDTLPLTPNGKVDYRALPPPHVSRDNPDESPLEDDLEETIAAVWRKVLRVDRVGPDENFFDLGGDSLLLIEAHADLQRRLGREFSIVEMFEFSTVRSLREHLNGQAAEKLAISEAELRARRQREAMERQRSVARRHDSQ